MTKQHEIDLLDKMIKQFGKDSYLGPWLADNRLSIVADIQNDVCISAALPGAARSAGETIIEDAKNAAAAIKDNATQWAFNLRAKAQQDADAQRNDARRVIERLRNDANTAINRLLDVI